MKKTLLKNEKNKNIVSQLKSLSYLLDESIKIPFTNYRIGLDPIIGFLPGAGDYLGAILSGYIVLQSARLGVNKATLSRMAINIITETLIGTIPILGDFFDANWKANTKNMELLNAHLEQPKKTKKADILFVVLLLTALLFILIISSIITFLIFKFIWTVFSQIQ